MSSKTPSPAMRKVGHRSYCNVESGVTMHAGPRGWEIYRPGPDGQEHFQTEWYFAVARRKARDLAAQIIAGKEAEA